jgi:6-pyruvoyltetrahydropterin/6-carboxytetrahydropterin synthase
MFQQAKNMKIIKEIQWDMGHRITNHHSKCRNLHGHRYKAEICLEGNIINIKGSKMEGMVMDFGDIAKLALERIYKVLDHGFIVWEKDKILMKFFEENPNLKHIIVPFVPTCENISIWIFNQIDSSIKDKYKTGLKLHSIRLWETPTSYSFCERKDTKKLKL